MDRLNAGAIALPGIVVRVLERCTSTNAVLLDAALGGVLLAAEEQTAGRGRRGRRWHAAPGNGVTFSLAHTVHRPLRELAGLALVAGVGVGRALRGLGLARVALKWPNDLVIGGAKLGGILVQTRGQRSGVLAVIGIGINCRHDADLAARLRRPVAALESMIRVDRNRVIEALARNVLQTLALFEAHGLEPLRAEWERMHAHAGARVRVRVVDGRVITGIACGLESNGALRLQTGARVRALSGASVVSARPA